MRWVQRENLYSPWTIDPTKKRYSLILATFFVVHLFLSWVIPPVEDELYYLAWSELPSLSYFDHPPMVAWWIRLSTFLFGRSILAIRLPALITHLVVFYQLGILSSRRNILYFLLLTPLSVFGSLFMTPDIPFLFFWLFYFRWTLQSDETLSSWSGDPISRVYRPTPLSTTHWLRGGVWLGLGLLSKYTMALAPICSLVIFLTRYRIRSWFKGFVIHGLIAGLLFSPVILFNLKHHFEPFLFQWNHTQLSVPFTFLFTFLGNQILLLGALPFLLFPWLVFSYRSLSRLAAFRVSFFFFVIPMVFFLFKSTHHFLEANWALASYLSFWVLAAYFWDQCSFRWIKGFTILISFSIPLLVTALISLHLVTPLPFLRAHQDRLGRMRALQTLAMNVRESLKEETIPPFFLPTYQWTAYFRFWVSRDSHQLTGLGRASHFTFMNVDPCQFSSIFFFQSSGGQLPSSLSCFKRIQKVGEYPLLLRGTQLESFELLKLHKEGHSP